jgi:hypothetical protein
MSDVICKYCGKPVLGGEVGPGPSHPLCHMHNTLQERVGVLMECGRGWTHLITQLVDDLDDFGLPYNILQIKEKFGGLRFYWCAEGDESGRGLTGTERDVSNEMQRRVDVAEQDSFSICEICGEPGRTRGEGWVRTLCDEHDEG